MFVVDFLIPCSVLAGMDENGHPTVQNQVVFVGEYFGFDSRKELEIPEGEVWTLPDGSIAKDSKDVELRGGAKTTVGDKYRVRTEWKKMVETAVAEMTGNKAIHLSRRDLNDVSRRNLMGQLDALSIVYNSNKCPIDDSSCAVALKTMIQHLREGCNDPACPARAYVLDSDYNTSVPVVDPMEAYILSALTELKMRHAFVPAVTFAQNNAYNRETLWSYIKYRQTLMAQMEQTQVEYKQAVEAGLNPLQLSDITRKILALRQQYNNLADSPAAAIYEQFQKKIQGDASYQRRESGLLMLLQAVREKTLDMSPAELQRRVKTIIRGIALSERKAAFNWNRHVAGSTAS
jgi:hypothetical protein